MSPAGIAAEALQLARTLVRCPSVADPDGTPRDGGAQAVLASVLGDLGFQIHALRFGATNNLFARIGDGGPHICFAGHTDVVPAGPLWSADPFAADIRNGVLYGRGACDMKGAVAAFVAAVSRLLPLAPGAGSISLLITGDEEGPATDGTVRVLEWMRENGQIPDMCVVGEPTNPTMLGEVIKIGRRGSLNAVLTVTGEQGHVAYPHLADNPVHRLIAALSVLTAAELDRGTAWFAPSCLQITSIDVGNPASNVIPSQATARLNIRFNDAHTGAALTAWLRDTVAPYAPHCDIAVRISGEAFLTAPGKLTDMLLAAVTSVCGTVPRLDTGGGTSDARFIARYCPVAEFGLVGATMHKADECVSVADLLALTDVYEALLRRVLGDAATSRPTPRADGVPA